MRRSKTIAAAAAAFIAGGAAVGALTLASGVAHGTTTPIPGLKMSSSQYTASYAWAQTVPVETTPATTTLSIPSGDRLTITSALVDVTGIGQATCYVNATVNGASVSYQIEMSVDGGASGYTSIYGESGSTMTCNDPSPGDLTLVGYLTPVPAGQT
jgi:hypothetical protein